MAQGTYLKIYRKMLDWEWYEDTNCVRVFLHLLLRANWEDSEYKGTPVPRGAVATGRKALSDQLGLSEREVRTVLKRLAKCKSIDQQSTNRFSIISVCEFDTYNPIKDADDQPNADRRPAKRRQATTSKEVKKLRSEETTSAPSALLESFEEAWKAYGRKGEKKASLRYWKKLGPADRKEIAERIPAYVADQESPTYQKDFQGWINPTEKRWQKLLRSELREQSQASAAEPKQSTETIGELEKF